MSIRNTKYQSFPRKQQGLLAFRRKTYQADIVRPMKSLCMHFIFLFFAASLWADNSAVLALEKKLNAMQTLQALFHQKVWINNKVISEAKGTMALKRPQYFRWDTSEPMEQKIVADGKKLWIYDVDLEQVTVKQQKEHLGETAALFLGGFYSHIAKDFSVQALNTNSFDLKSKAANAHFQRIILLFKNNILSQLTFYDPLGQKTVVDLTQIKQNQPIAAQFFEFKAPKGVDVVF